MGNSHKTILALFFLLPFFVSVVNAQTAFALMPNLSFGPEFCHFNKGPQSSDWFTVRKYGDSDPPPDWGGKIYQPYSKQFGLLLRISPANKKYNMIAGITTGAVAYRYSFNVSDSQGYQLAGTSLFAIRFPIYFTFPIGKREHEETDTIDGKAYTYHHKSVFKVIFGVTFIYLTQTMFSSAQFYDSAGIINHDTLSFRQYQNIQNRFSASVSAGLMWTWYSKRRKGKELLSLMLYYEQGTFNMVKAPMYFYKNSTVTEKELSTRGSQLQVAITFPIILNKKQ